MIIQSTEKFVESLNRLPRGEAKNARRFLRPLCAAIEALPEGYPISSIALSNYQICEERNPELTGALGKDKIYGITFDGYYLAVAVMGRSPEICRLLTVKKKAGG